jgi:hypothetical protein
VFWAALNSPVHIQPLTILAGDRPMIRNRLSRVNGRARSAGVLGGSMSRWMEVLANDAVQSPQRKRSVILLWMNGGPSQMDTFDMKPGHGNGGPFKEIATNVPGIKISEHLPKIAQHVDKMAIIRSMSTMENEHERATFHLRTGYQPWSRPVPAARLADQQRTGRR